MAGIFNASIFNNAIFNTGAATSASIGGGASGKRYAPPSWWGGEKKKKKLEALKAEVVVLQKRIEAKRHQIDVTPKIERIERLIEQITKLQWKILDLLARIDEMNKEIELAEEDEAIVSYIAHRMLH